MLALGTEKLHNQIVSLNFRCKLITTLYVALFLISLAPFHVAAQTNDPVDDSFDPFSDYNEYEIATEEEADINFFKNGRYLTLAVAGGYRGFVGGGFSQAYRPSFAYGFQGTYFFDLQLALNIGYMNADHNLFFSSYSDDANTSGREDYTGKVNIQIADIGAKYYFNSDNVTKGLADLNPYFHIGSGYYIRKYSISKSINPDEDKVWGLKFGAGLEIPMLRRRAYLGLQGTYHYVQFPDENKRRIPVDDSNTKPVSPQLNGDIIELTVFLGMNF